MLKRIMLGVPGVIFTLLAVMAIAPSGGSFTVAEASHKVTICHIPPGNPSNAHLITMSQNALSAHLAHEEIFQMSQ